MTDPFPLVTCMMPTFGRPDYVAESIAQFLQQDYPAKELIVLNDCPGQTLIADQPNVRVINVSSRWETLGEKRNFVIEQARGEYIAVWDDDDVYLPWRLSSSMDRIRRESLPFFCPLEYWAYWGSPTLETNRTDAEWIWHPPFIFRRDDWQRVGGYPNQTLYEDSYFLKQLLALHGVDWKPLPLPKSERSLILRGRSKYQHTSISGGEFAPDTTSGVIHLQPTTIQDSVLREARDRLVAERTDAVCRRTLAHERSNLWPGVAHDALRRPLKDLPLLCGNVGYGQIGWSGSLGYENQQVEINGEFRPGSVSAHAPSELKFQLNAQFDFFCCEVALNDDVAHGQSAADFLVYVDGQLRTLARSVRSRQVPVALQADVRGGRELHLVIRPHRWECCHSVWIDPVLVTNPVCQPVPFRDALNRGKFDAPSHEAARLPELCIATTGSADYAEWIEDLFGSICGNGQCPDALLAIISLDGSEVLRQVAKKYRAALIPCHVQSPLNMTVKSVLYSISRLIPAKRYICLDADMLVFDDLRPIVHAIDAAPEGSLLICREAKWAENLGDAIETIYKGKVTDLESMLGGTARHEARYPLVVNDGFMAGSRAALTSLDDRLRSLVRAAEWVDDPNARIPWRNQAILNLALAAGNSGVEVDSRFNVQLNVRSLDVRKEPGGRILSISSEGQAAAIVHFNGGGRFRSSELRNRYRLNSRPLIGRNHDGITFNDFTTHLRRWLATCGTNALAWSFYGSPDGTASDRCDASQFSLFDMLYSLIRSSGFRRIIETGTARGISAACLASAVSSQPNAAVVTIDLDVWPERQSFWSMFPELVQGIIQPRQGDSIQLLKKAVENRESYDAALLDSVHTAEHVLQEFEYARQLVSRGGLILIHDIIWQPGTVDLAVRQIEQMGYGVARLWTNRDCPTEDAGLGLAIVENR